MAFGRYRLEEAREAVAHKRGERLGWPSVFVIPRANPNSGQSQNLANVTRRKPEVGSVIYEYPRRVTRELRFS